jgi:hypothetical protein
MQGVFTVMPRGNRFNPLLRPRHSTAKRRAAGKPVRFPGMNGARRRLAPMLSKSAALMAASDIRRAGGHPRSLNAKQGTSR